MSKINLQLHNFIKEKDEKELPSETSEQRDLRVLPQLLRGNLTKIVTFGTKSFVCYSRHVHYLGCLLLGAFTV